MVTTKKKKTSSVRKAPENKSLLKQSVSSYKKRVDHYLTRRPHRSFRRTRRRDYERSLKLPGYWVFTDYVRSTLWRHKSLFLWVVIVYGIFTAAFIGIASQDVYKTLANTLQTTGDEIFEGNWGEIGKAGILLVSGVSGGLTATPTEPQQIYGAFFAVMTWLTTVWLLRALLAGQKPKFRDGLYNAGAAIIPTLLVSFVLIVQLIPAAVATILLSTAVGTGFIEGAVGMMLTVVSLLLYLLSLYWVVSTLISLVIVTLPGMYPMQALRTAGDLVIGRRLRILYRWLWLGGIVAAVWAIVMIPIIIIDTWLKSLLPAIVDIPTIPVVLLVMSSATLVFTAAYIYLLYRKVVEDDAKPA